MVPNKLVGECPVCFDTKQVYKFSCTHMLCPECVNNMPNTLCTMCREDFVNELDEKAKKKIDVNRKNYEDYLDELAEEMAGQFRETGHNLDDFILYYADEINPDEEYKPPNRVEELDIPYSKIPIEEYNDLIKDAKNFFKTFK